MEVRNSEIFPNLKENERTLIDYKKQFICLFVNNIKSDVVADSAVSR